MSDNKENLEIMELLNKILDFSKIDKAYRQVVANKGSKGVDGVTTAQLQDYMHDRLYLPHQDNNSLHDLYPCSVPKKYHLHYRPRHQHQGSRVEPNRHGIPVLRPEDRPPGWPSGASVWL